MSYAAAFLFDQIVSRSVISIIFQGVFGIYQGATNHEELHNLMKATVLIRRLKKDVLSELPVKRRQQVAFCQFVYIALYVCEA